MHNEQHQDREREAAHWRFTRDMRAASGDTSWNRLRCWLGSRLVAWGEHLQTEYQANETGAYPGVQRTAHPMV